MGKSVEHDESGCQNREKLREDTGLTPMLEILYPIADVGKCFPGADRLFVQRQEDVEG